MANVFSDAMADILADENIGVDIVYQSPAGDVVECRAVYDEQPEEVQLYKSSKVLDAARLLLVRVRDIPAPVSGATVTVAGVPYRLFTSRASDPQDGCWQFQLTAS